MIVCKVIELHFLKYLLENSLEEDLIISLDADNTHNPKQISSMIEYFEENKF